jgi:hypothetical protein
VDFVEASIVFRFFQANVDCLGVAEFGASNEACSGLDIAGCTDGEEDRAARQARESFVEVVGLFAEPNNVRAEGRAAHGASFEGIVSLVGGGIGERSYAAFVTSAFEEFAV